MKENSSETASSRETGREAVKSCPVDQNSGSSVSSGNPTISSGFSSKYSKYSQFDHIWTDDEAKKIMTGESAVA